MISHKKAFGVYHWDTFDNVTLLVHEEEGIQAAEAWVAKHYEGRIRRDGADGVDIVDLKGNIVRAYKVG